MIKRPAIIDVGGVDRPLSQPVLRTRSRKTAIPAKRHVVPSGTVDVLDNPPATPARVWFGVPHDQGDILYLHASSEAAIHEWLVLKGLARLGQGPEEPAIVPSAGVSIDIVRHIVLEPTEFDFTDPDNPAQTAPAVLMGGVHANVRLPNP